MKTVKLEVMKNGAVYVNDSRITDRSTKPWGGTYTVFTVDTLKRNVVKTLVDNGFSIKRIDTEPYLKQTEKYL